MRRSAWLARPLLRALLLLAAASPLRADEGAVRTSREGARVLPLPKEEGSFHFLVFGDRTGGPREGVEVLRRAVTDANLLAPDLVMTVGDLVEGYNARREWLEEMREYRGVMDGLEMPWFPVAGNHDVYWKGGVPPPGQHESDYEEHFGPLWYWFPHKNAAFVVLYTDEGDRATNRKGWYGPSVNRMGPEQLAWLRDTLRATRSYDHVLVFLHHPRWVAEVYPGTNWDEVHAVLRDAGNVTAVFGGHVHRQRWDGVRDGIRYLTLATTGGGIPMDVPGTGYLHHMNLVTVRREGIAIATIPVGATIDPRDMTPERRKDVDDLAAAVPDLGDGRFDLDARGAGAGELRIVVANPTSRPVEVALEPSADRGFAFAPDHAHLRLAPGESRTVGIAWRRGADAGLGGLEVPSVSWRFEYLAPSMRVALPAGRVAPPFSIPVPEPSPEDPRRALDLGPGGCVEVRAGDMELPDGPLTVEGWLNATTYEGSRAFLAKTERSDFGLFVSDARPVFTVFLGPWYVEARAAEPVLAPGRWHHLAGVFDGAEVRLYVDGRLVARTPGSGARRRGSVPFLVGADPDATGAPTSPLAGLVDEVRVSTVARYAGDAFAPAARHAPDEDTALLLHLDDGVGPLAPDASAHGRHGLRRGAVGYVAR